MTVMNGEKYNLADQMKFAAVSIPANIAEGHGRFYYQDNVRFCYTMHELQAPYLLEDSTEKD